MSETKTVIKNASFMLVGNLIFRLISLVIAIYLAKYLGVEDFGKYTFVFVYLSFFSILTDLGLTTILVREMSREIKNMPKMVGNAYIIKIILSVFTILVSISLSSAIYSKEITTYVFIASFTLLFEALIAIHQTMFQTTLKMKYHITAKLTFKIISAILILCIVNMHGSLFQVILALTFSELIEVILSYVYSTKITKIDFNIDFELWKKLFKLSFPIALSGIFLIIYNRVDVMMLSMMKDDSAIGLYSAAYNLSEPLILIPNSIVASLFPVMSKSYINSTETLLSCYEKGLKYTIITMLPVAIGTTLIADKIILLVYGQSYTGSIVALKILIWSLLLTSINYLLTTLLISINKEKLTTLSILICIFINIIMNYLLIPQYSYNGASVATVASSIVLFIMSLYFLSKNKLTISASFTYSKPIAAGLIMGTYVYFLNIFEDINIFLVITSAALVYIIALIAVKTFPKDEMIIIRKALKTKIL